MTLHQQLIMASAACEVVCLMLQAVSAVPASHWHSHADCDRLNTAVLVLPDH